MAVGEAVSGSARTFGILVLGRVLVGISLGCSGTGAFLIVGLICRNTAERAIYLSLVTALYGIMIKIGPLIAGALLDRSLSYWRWCFYIEIPILGVTFLLLLLGTPSLRTSQNHFRSTHLVSTAAWRMSLGILLQAALAVTLLLPCMLGGTTLGWTSGVLVTCYVMTPFLLLAFVVSEYHSPDAIRLTPVPSFKNRRFIAITVITYCAIAITFASTYYVSIVCLHPCFGGIR